MAGLESRQLAAERVPGHDGAIDEHGRLPARGEHRGDKLPLAVAALLVAHEQVKRRIVGPAQAARLGDGYQRRREVHFLEGHLEVQKKESVLASR